MPQTKPIISIENVVASASVDQKMDLNEITKLEIRTVRITSVEAIEGKTRIALGVIDTGERTMQVIIGGADKFDPTSLIGVQAVAVTNMVPKTIAGITSEAMLLAADVDGVPFWLTPNGQVPDGTLIK